MVNPLDLMVKGRPFIKNFRWQPERGTRLTVVNRQTGDLVGQYVTQPFFAFHHANAFEKENTLHIDLVTYPDATILTGESLYVDANEAQEKGKEKEASRLERLSLSLETGEVQSDVLFSKPTEFPRINERWDGKPYRYLYLAGMCDPFSQEPSLNQGKLYKINTATKEVLEWSETGCSVGEPVFVAAPNAQEEDEGVILAVILDYTQANSFLLLLDAKTFKELGRAKAPHLIPEGFHGQYFE